MLENSFLGKSVKYKDNYDPTLLFAVPRELNRSKLQNINNFYGIDIWNAYEVSWLDNVGMPKTMVFSFFYDASSEFIIESKSLKLYLNSFNNTKFVSENVVKTTILQDISHTIQAETTIFPQNYNCTENISGFCLDNLAVECSKYQPEPTLLKTDNSLSDERLYTHNFKSNCLITGQPDFATIIIDYTGYTIEKKSLIQYLVSYRKHNEFHEHAVERIFCDIMEIVKPEKLSVYARFTRRGGVDINPFRTSNKNFLFDSLNFRTTRQ